MTRKSNKTQAITVTRMELRKIISQLNEAAPLKCYIGGSWALRNVYGILDRDAMDIDLIVFGWDEEIHNPLVENFKIVPKSKYDDGRRCYSPSTTGVIDAFYMEGKYKGKDIYINVLILEGAEKYVSQMTVKFDNFDIVPLPYILIAKREAARDKDFMDMHHMTHNIINASKDTIVSNAPLDYSSFWPHMGDDGKKAFLEGEESKK